MKLALRRHAHKNRLRIQYWAQNMGADTRLRISCRTLPSRLDAATAATLAQKAITVRDREQMAAIRNRSTVFLCFS